MVIMPVDGTFAELSAVVDRTWAREPGFHNWDSKVLHWGNPWPCILLFRACAGRWDRSPSCRAGEHPTENLAPTFLLVARSQLSSVKESVVLMLMEGR